MDLNDKINVSNETANRIFSRLSQLSAGDIVNYQSGLPEQTIHSVAIIDNSLWVHIDDPEDWPENPDHSVSGLFVAIEDDERGDSYLAPSTEIQPTNLHEPDSLGTITDVEIGEAESDHPTADRIATIHWELNSETIIPHQAPHEGGRIDEEVESTREDVRYNETVITWSDSGPDFFESGVDNPNFMLFADSDGQIGVYPTRGRDKIATFDVSQLHSDYAEQVDDIIDTEVREKLIGNDPEFPFPNLSN